MKMAVQIEEVAIDDFDKYKQDLIKLQYENTSLHFPKKIIDINDTMEKVNSIKEYMKEEKAFLFVAKEEDNVLGFLWCYPRVFFDEKRIYINSLIVKSKYRGNSIGKRLVESAEKKALDLDYDAIDVSTAAFNEGGLRFYRRYGFLDERIQLVKNIKRENENG